MYMSSKLTKVIEFHELSYDFECTTQRPKGESTNIIKLQHKRWHIPDSTRTYSFIKLLLEKEYTNAVLLDVYNNPN